MPDYKAPLDDMRFILNEVLNISELSKLSGYDDVDVDTINSILSEGAKFNEKVLAPLNFSGDREGCHYNPETGEVKTPKGFKEAYEQFIESMWGGLNCDPEYGGMGMPNALTAAFLEMVCSANMSFGMYPGLSHGAYNALHEYGTDEQKDVFLPKLVDGSWSGTMCLTEPHCGTDLGLMKTKAVEQEDGTYKITGEKIFISAGEHDLTENICHLVLAKIDSPDTPEGIKGVSLFIVPKYQIDDNGEVSDKKNGVRCGGIEEKMGIHANSTCTMNFDGAVGTLVGEKHDGMRAMFVMMNEARQNVGIQGLGLMEASYQGAVTYASERPQGKVNPFDKSKKPTDADMIIGHPGVRRDLMHMKALTEAGRMLAYWTGLQLDHSIKNPNEEEKKKAQDLLDFMTPIVKGHLTDCAHEVTNRGIQVFGGHGFIEENGMAQYARDARITQLYEGTNGVQALDLMMRKTMQLDLVSTYLKEVDRDLKSMPYGMGHLTGPMKDAVKTLRSTTRGLKYKAFWLRKDKGKMYEMLASAADDYAKMTARVAMGHMWLKMAATAQERLDEGVENKEFYETKLKTANFYMEKILPDVKILQRTIKAGPKTLTDIAAENFVHSQTTIAEEARPTNRKKRGFFSKLFKK